MFSSPQQHFGAFAVFPTTSVSPSPPDIPLESMERKQKKPIMERKRRERINQSLNVLKEILMEAMPTQSSKLEKADILEMTVQYIRRLQTQARSGSSSALTKEEHLALSRRSYQAGCAETTRVTLSYLEVVLPEGPQRYNLELGLVNELRQVSQSVPPTLISCPLVVKTTAQSAHIAQPHQLQPLVSPFPSTSASTKSSSPGTPESAYGSSPETESTPNTSAGSALSSLGKRRFEHPTTPVARPELELAASPALNVETDDDDVDVVDVEKDDEEEEDAQKDVVDEEDGKDSDVEPPAAKRSKLWRPF